MKFYKKEFLNQQLEIQEEERIADSKRFKKKLSPITAKMRSKLTTPWNTKKYTFNNS